MQKEKIEFNSKKVTDMQYGQCGICGFNSSDGIIRNDSLYACKSDRYSCWKAIVLLTPKIVKCECKKYNRKIIYVRTIENKEILLLQPLCSRCYISCKGRCQTKDCKNDREWISPTEQQQQQFVYSHWGRLLKYCSPQCTLQENKDIFKSEQVYSKSSKVKIIRGKESSWNKPWKKETTLPIIIRDDCHVSQDTLEELHNRIKQIEKDKIRLLCLVRKLQRDNTIVRAINRTFSYEG